MNYISFKTLRRKLDDRSRSAIYRDVVAGRLPKPIKIGGKLYWASDTIDKHLSCAVDEVPKTSTSSGSKIASKSLDQTSYFTNSIGENS